MAATEGTEELGEGTLSPGKGGAVERLGFISWLLKRLRHIKHMQTGKTLHKGYKIKVTC